MVTSKYDEQVLFFRIIFICSPEQPIIICIDSMGYWDPDDENIKCHVGARCNQMIMMVIEAMMM